MGSKDVRTEESVENPEHVSSLVAMLQRIGQASNYTGMMDVEFFMPEDPSTGVSILEFNPRFSGAVHSSLTSGFLEDYLDVLYKRRTPDTLSGFLKTFLRLQSQMPVDEGDHMATTRSDGHDPDSRLKDYNLAKFYASRPWMFPLLRKFNITH